LKELAQQQSENKVVQDAPPGRELEGLVNPKPLLDFKIPEECFYSEYDEETLQEIMDEQMNVVKMLKKHDQSKHMANRVLMIFDDCVGSRLFNNRKDNPFKKLNTNHRHYSASILMVSLFLTRSPKLIKNYQKLYVQTFHV